MKKQLSLIAAAGAALVLAAPTFAQTGTLFTPGTATNPDSSKVQPSGVVGDANEFDVVGTIDEFIRITSVDDKLEFGNLGGPTLMGTASTASGLDSTSGPFSKNTANTTTSPTVVGEDGTAGVEGEANSYINIVVNYGANLLNPGPNTAAAATSDDYVLPTSFRATAKGKFTFGAANANSIATYTTSAGYAPFSPAVPAGTNGAQITFAPGYGNGAKVMGQATRNGLNDYKGTYSTTVALSYFKF